LFKKKIIQQSIMPAKAAAGKAPAAAAPTDGLLFLYSFFLLFLFFVL
jgi:hypothetical protein